MELSPPLTTYSLIAQSSGLAAMLGMVVLRSALAACSTLLGSVGVFFLYLSVLHPALSPHALFFLSAASGIVLSAPK